MLDVSFLDELVTEEFIDSEYSLDDSLFSDDFVVNLSQEYNYEKSFDDFY